MIIDQGIGTGFAQADYFGLGWAWTVVSATGIVEVTPTLVGQWSNVIACQSANQRIECQSSNVRIE